jgi:hypothetical protein
MTTDEAPDFAPGYPSGGKRIGPGWQTLWKMMASGNWHKGTALAEKLSPSSGLAVTTLKNLLRDAVKAGHLEVELRFEGKLGGYKSKRPAIRSAWYRRAL